MLASPNNCTGCQACVSTCPTNSITMEIGNNSLHVYPVINDKTCINCGKCTKKCPQLQSNIFKNTIEKQKFYCAWSKDSVKRKLSTSGGVASALYEEAVNKGYSIVGAAFDEKWKLGLRLSDDDRIIEKFRGSKYLQSESNDVYNEVLKEIRNGKHVLFVGTPCQIEAVKLIVPICYHEQLITCGIICHGVNSPKVWEDYVAYLERMHKSRLTTYNFRSKAKGWGKLFVEYSFSNGKKIEEPAWKNIFHVWFGQHYILRESCFHCTYRVENRNSDIVIGDFWGIDKIMPKLDSSEGVSVVVTTSQKGESFVNSCSQIEKIEVNGTEAKKVLKGYLDSQEEDVKVYQIQQNKLFANEYKYHSFSEMIKKHPCPTLVSLLIASLKYHLHIK